MERLETSLDDLLEHMPNIPLSLKCSVLEDVASGLLYLHKRESPIIHRDLTSNNVLLTSSLVAKITDMGNSRIVNMRPGQMARTLTEFPGTLVYMPPEALDNRHRYGPPLDVFSFGHLALYTMIQVFPGELLSATYVNPDNNQEILARSEVERREEYVGLLESRLALPTMVQLIKQCLHNDPQQRPGTEELLTRLQGIRGQVEGEYGGPIKLDLVRIKLAKKLQEKDRRMNEMAQEHARQQEQTTRIIEDNARQLQELQADIQAKDDIIAAKDEHIAEIIVRKDREIATVQDLRRSLECELENRETEIHRMKQQKQCDPNDEGIPFQFVWHRGPDIPKWTTEHVQSVVIQGKVYVGGGYSGHNDRFNYIIMKYDRYLGKWTTLPAYRSYDFTMAAINNELVVIGGYNFSGSYSNGFPSKTLGVWRGIWSHPYPEMPLALSHCSAVVYNEWLVTAGGVADFKVLSRVQVFNTDSKQWHIGKPTPIPFYGMKTVILHGSTAYFMGGYTTNDEIAHFGADIPATNMYSVSLPALISQLSSADSAERERPIWKEVHKPLPLIRCAPLSINGLLFALGGWNTRSQKVGTAIYLYQPNTGDWMKVGDMPSPRRNFTCAAVSEEWIVAAGGNSNSTLDSALDSVGIASIVYA